jgi:C1A family cysteine protease
MPPIYTQGDLGSCTANALCAAMQYLDNKEGSRLFLYYNEIDIEGLVNDDSGATLEDGINSLLNTGVCEEKFWPYNINNFKIKPTENCYANAQLHKAIHIEQIDSNPNLTPTEKKQIMKTVLAQGYPIILGIDIYESFEYHSVSVNGLVPFPNVYKEKYLGGHAILVVGYDHNKLVHNNIGAWICRNSWGPNWGDHGYFYLPYKYLSSNMVSNMYIIIKIRVNRYA